MALFPQTIRIFNLKRFRTISPLNKTYHIVLSTSFKRKGRGKFVVLWSLSVSSLPFHREEGPSYTSRPILIEIFYSVRSSTYRVNFGFVWILQTRGQIGVFLGMYGESDRCFFLNRRMIKEPPPPFLISYVKKCVDF